MDVAICWLSSLTQVVIFLVLGTMETVRDFIFLGSKVIADCDCSHEIKRRLLRGRKAMTNLDNILKSRDITLPKGLSGQSYGFSSGHVWI